MKVEIGDGYQVDNGVIIGYETKRDISNRNVFIGKKPIIRSGTVIYVGVKIGDYLETGHNVVIREDNIIEDSLRIWSNSYIDYGCKIGNNVKIHCNVYIPQYTEIDDDVFLAPGVILANDVHPICTKCMKGPIIKKGAKIGANVTVLPQVVIGEGSLVGAGAVVTKDVLPNSVVIGNPATFLCNINQLKCKKGIKEIPYSEILRI